MTNQPTAAFAVPGGDDWIVQELRKLRRDIDELRNARSLESASMSAGALVLNGGTIQTQDFDGNVETGTPGTAGFALGGVTQGQAVANTLSPRNELISNDALVSPLAGVEVDGTVHGITLPAAEAVLHTETVTVPDGFTMAFVFAAAQVGGNNPSLSIVDVISARAVVGGVPGDNVLTNVDPDRTDHSVAFFSTTLTGLSGSFDVSVSGYGLSGGFSGATARVTGFVIFAR